MNSRDKKVHISTETKKEYIVRLAKEDPFLKIEQIANFAKTTSRYVRTILSEANLSLMHLREEYARKMEKKSESKILFSLNESLVNIHIQDKGNGPAFSYSAPKIEIVDSYKDVYWNYDNVLLYRYFQHIYYYKKPIGIIEFITKVKLDVEKLNQENGVFNLIGLNSDEVRFASPEIEIGKLADLLSYKGLNFELQPDDPIIKINAKITVKERILGEEIFYFPGEYVKLMIPGIFSPILEHIK
ncbi:MAG: hypothetical protein KAX49_19275 [Halanaerobiales bacterium]|nr:hypothetical protein [Halanaerobiales bacterium]